MCIRDSLPTREQFFSLGSQCLIQAFEMIFKVYSDFKDITELNEVIDEEITEEKIWVYNHITVRSALILLYQGVEYLMKGRVTGESVFLLLEQPKTDWPSLPKRKSRKFDEMQTISGGNLLSVFCTVDNEISDIYEFVERFKKLRVNRNKLVHGAGRNDKGHDYIIKEIMFYHNNFFSKGEWVNEFREFVSSEPTFGYWDYDAEEAMFYKKLNFIERTIGKKALNNYLEINTLARRYFCPSCTYHLNGNIDREDMPKWAFLKPNKPNSKNLLCITCSQEFQVGREDCHKPNCCLLYTSPSPRDATLSRMPSSA